MSTGYIPDGYTRKGFIRGVSRLFPDVKFIYRPILLAERAELNAKLALADAKQVEKLAADAVAKHVVSWDMQHEDNTLPIDAATILRLEPSLFDRLYSIIHGRQAGDEAPDGWSDSPLPAESEQEKN